MPLPEDIKISELLKVFYLKNGLENHYCRLVSNATIISQNDETKSNALFSSAIITIKAITMNNVPYTFGKLITVYISYFEKKIENWIFDIGVLNSINYIISKNESFYHRKVKKLEIGNLVIKRDDKRSLLSLGITKDFNCCIDFEKI